MGYQITKDHGSSGTATRKQQVKYIVVHYTAGAGTAKGQASGTCSYFRSGASGRGVGAHYCIDDGTICEYADPKTKITYHCGGTYGGNIITNNNSIGIEVCQKGNSPYTQAEIDRLTWLVQKLMKQFNLTSNKVVRHYDCGSSSKKPCPWYYTPSGAGGNKAWQTLHNQITKGTVMYSGGDDGSSSISDPIGQTVVITDPATAYAVGINSSILFKQEDIYPYMVTLDENSPKQIDINKLKGFGVIGACIHMGSYYTASHKVNTGFRSSRLDEQIQLCQIYKLPFGLYTNMRARTQDEAELEMYEIKQALRRYPPQMGMWLKLNFTTSNKTLNDSILNYYYREFYKLGLKDQMGLYCAKSQLEKLNWENHCDNWLWWMDRHLKTVDKIHNLPTPDFFRYDGVKDEEALIEPDFEAAANLTFEDGTGGTGAGVGTLYNGIYTQAQLNVSNIAEKGTGVNLTAGMCAAFVNDVIKKAGYPRPSGNAIDYWTKWKSSGGTDKNPPIGSVVVGSGWGSAGATYGHVGVVLVGGRIADNIGGRRITNSVDEWAAGMSAVSSRYHIKGYIGWVWANGRDLSKEGKVVGGGKVIQIPETYNGMKVGTLATYELDPATYSLSYDAGRIQKAWKSKGSKYSALGAATIDSKLLIACTSTFGKVGDWVTWIFNDGTVLETIIADEKDQTTAHGTPANKWGHVTGGIVGVLEFQGKHSKLGNNPYNALGLKGKRTVQAVNHGKVV